MTENDLNVSDLVKALETFNAPAARDAADRLRFSLLRGDDVSKDELLVLISTLRNTLHRMVVAPAPRSGIAIRSYDPRPGAR